jgi:hypothetical protein
VWVVSLLVEIALFLFSQVELIMASDVLPHHRNCLPQRRLGADNHHQVGITPGRPLIRSSQPRSSLALPIDPTERLHWRLSTPAPEGEHHVFRVRNQLIGPGSGERSTPRAHSIER